MVFVNIETATDNRKRRGHERGSARRLAAALVLACLCASIPAIKAQSSPSPADTQRRRLRRQADPSRPNQSKDIPDAPSTAQPPVEKPEPPPIPRPEEKKPVERDPWTNQPINKPAATQPAAAAE